MTLKNPEDRLRAGAIAGLLWLGSIPLALIGVFAPVDSIASVNGVPIDGVRWWDTSGGPWEIGGWLMGLTIAAAVLAVFGGVLVRSFSAFWVFLWTLNLAVWAGLAIHQAWWQDAGIAGGLVIMVLIASTWRARRGVDEAAEVPPEPTTEQLVALLGEIDAAIDRPASRGLSATDVEQLKRARQRITSQLAPR